MRQALILTAMLSLGACAENGGNLGTYSPPSGDATYDAIKAASEQCKTRGGELRLKTGGDGRELSEYECKIGKAN